MSKAKQRAFGILVYILLAVMIFSTVTTTMYYYERWKFTREGTAGIIEKQRVLIERYKGIVDRYERMVKEGSR